MSRSIFRWGASVLAILHHFSTPEVRALFRYCRKLIKDFCNPLYEGDGLSRPPSFHSKCTNNAVWLPAVAQIVDDLRVMASAVHLWFQYYQFSFPPPKSARRRQNVAQDSAVTVGVAANVAIDEMFTQMAEQPSRHCVEVVQLVRARLSRAVSFLGPSWTLPLPSRGSFERWDASRFGVLPEPASR